MKLEPDLDPETVKISEHGAWWVILGAGYVAI